MKKVAITGGIGSGKSTVVAEFKKLGVPAFVADSVAALYYEEPDFVSKLVQTFGTSVVAHGVVDKKKLADIVFSDRSQLMLLNSLIHPRIISDFETFCSAFSDEPYVLFESAILYEYGFNKMMDKTICVYLSFDERIRRIKLRDNVSEQQIMLRMANQLPADFVMKRADYVVLNYEGNPRSRQVEYLNYVLQH